MTGDYKPGDPYDFDANAVSFLFETDAGNSVIFLGDTFQMTAIAAIVIGGTSMSGGEGSVLGAILGALILTLIVNARRAGQSTQQVSLVRPDR